jgi:hypothetical protein
MAFLEGDSLGEYENVHADPPEDTDPPDVDTPDYLHPEPADDDPVSAPSDSGNSSWTPPEHHEHEHNNTYYPPYIPDQGGGSYTPPPVPTPPPPPTPRYITVTRTRYNYLFGLDKLDVCKVLNNNNCCMISKDIYVGDMGTNDYIQFDAQYNVNDYSSIEFYIIDGQIVAPIMSTGDKQVFNEKIFYGLPTRFSVDTTKPIQIKKNGVLIDMDLEKAIKSNDADYTVSYTPLNAWAYTPVNSNIKLKVIMRLYDINEANPYLVSARFKKFGGDALWQNNI